MGQSVVTASFATLAVIAVVVITSLTDRGSEQKFVLTSSLGSSVPHLKLRLVFWIIYAFGIIKSHMDLYKSI